MLTISNNTASSYKAVIFDMMGVITNSHKEIISRIEKRNGLEPDCLFNAFKHPSVQRILVKLESGQITFGEADEIFCEDQHAQHRNRNIRENKISAPSNILSSLLEVASIADPWTQTGIMNENKILNLLRTSFGEYEASVRYNQKMIQYIRFIRENTNLKTAILTNNYFVDSARQRSLLYPYDKNLFDVIIESCRLNTRKPNFDIFDYTMKTLKCTFAETLFLDDKTQNVKAAEALGMTAIKVDDIDTAIDELNECLGLPDVITYDRMSA